MLVKLFLNKYGIEVNQSQMNLSYFTCDRID